MLISTGFNGQQLTETEMDNCSRERNLDICPPSRS